MKPPFIQQLAVFLFATGLSLGSMPVAAAQAAAPEPAAQGAAQVKFGKLTFTRGRVAKGKLVILNDYFLPKQGPKNWTHKLSMYVYPKLNDPELYVKNMTANLAKEGIKATPLKTKSPRVSALTYYEKTEHMIKYNVFAFHTTKSGKTLIGRQFTLRAKPEKEKPFRTLVAVQRDTWGNELVSAQFPGFKFPPKSAEPTADGANKDLPVLKPMVEKVDDIRGSGHVVRIDAAFALKQGSDKKIKAPFSIALPQTEHVLTLANPKVPETVRFTLTNDQKEYLESIRFTGLTIGTADPMQVRLQKAVALVNRQTVPKFFNGYEGGKVVGTYRTQIGPNQAGVILARMNHKDGRKFFVKFVALLPEGKPHGLLVVLLVNGSVGEKAEVKQKLGNGFGQKVLHSVRFEN